MTWQGWLIVLSVGIGIATVSRLLTAYLILMLVGHVVSDAVDKWRADVNADDPPPLSERLRNAKG